MKTQLLEDIGDNSPSRPGPAVPQPAPQPAPAAQPAAAAPGVATPDATMRDVATPDVAAPDATMWDVATPDATTPGVATPGVATPRLATRREPAVWHRASQREAAASAQRAAGEASVQRAPQPSASFGGQAPVPPPGRPAAPAAPGGTRMGAPPFTPTFAPQPPFSQPPPAPSLSPSPPPEPAPPPRARRAPEIGAGAFSASGPGDIPTPPEPVPGPDPLAEHLRRNAVHEPQPEPDAVSGWTRRALSWSLGISLLAGVLAAGLWLYEDRRVEGALVVVANTAPEGAAHGSVAPRAAMPATLLAPAPAPVADAAAPATPATPATPAPATPQPPVDPAPAASTPPASAQDTTTPPPETATADSAEEQAAPRVRRHARHTRKREAPVIATAPRAPAEPSPGQRREETLMQCRAHGYDERQCFARGCEMTRFGFACRG